MAKRQRLTGNVGAGSASAFRWPEPGGVTASGEHWSYKNLTEGAQIDLSAGQEDVEDFLFVTDDLQFRIYFDSAAALIQAHAFFGLAYFSMFELIYFAPEFDQVLVEFQAQGDRTFTVGVIEGLVYFHLDLGNEFGLILQLHHPDEV